MSRTIRLLTLALGLSALLAPAAAHASPTQTSIMMDDDLLVYRDDSTAPRADADEVARRRHRPRDRPVEDRRRERALHEGRDQEAPKGKFRTAASKQNKRFKATNPSTYPVRNWDRYDNLLKSAADRGDSGLLQRHGPGPGVGARQGADEEQGPARGVEAQARGLQAVRAGGRQALRRDLPRRERQPQRPPAREVLVAVERAQPGRLAGTAVGASRRRDRAGVAGAVSQAAPVRLQGPVRERPSRRHRHHPDGRDGAAGVERPQREGADAPRLLLA